MTAEPLRSLSAAKHVKAFSPHHAPAYRVAPGERVRVETLCSASGSIRRPATAESNDELRAKVGWMRGMPMTGPIFVEGAEPGDALAVRIDAIAVADVGWTDVMIGRGAVADLITEAEVRTFRIVDGAIDFGFGVQLPLTPMIGAIGTAPRDQALDAGIPAALGGNLDCTLVKPQSTLYLPVNVPGALLGLGDLHAAMGDGEVGNAGLEVGGSVTLRCAVVKDHGMPLPLVDTGTLVATIASAPNLERAARQAVQTMVRWIVQSSDLSINDAAMLVSFAGDLRVCQVVNSLMTCRLEMPKNVLGSLGIELLAFTGSAPHG
ncbi:MAG: acetamidase/formamidase family protein [Thermomicrobiales bacterium]